MPRAHHRAGQSARSRVLSLRRVLPVTTAIADRRVLRRVRARDQGQAAAGREHDPGQPHAVDDPRGPVGEHHADALPGAVDADHQRARCGCGRALGRSRGRAAARRAGAHRDRQPAQPAGERLKQHPAAHRELRLGDHGARQQHDDRRAVHRRGQPDCDPHRQSADRATGFTAAASDVPRAAAPQSPAARRDDRRQPPGAR